MRDVDSLNSEGSGKSSYSQEQTMSKLVSSKFKTSSTKCQEKKHKVKLKSHKHRAGTNKSKKTVTDSSIKAPLEDSSNKKVIIRKYRHKTDGKSSRMLSSTKLEGGKNSHSSGIEGNDVDGEENIKKHKRRKKKRQRNNMDVDDASRLRRRTRYLLIKMKLEQNLIDAYSGEGWKGQRYVKIF